MVTLSIIVLTYNSSKHIQNCLESIIERYATAIKKGNIELIVGDNNSSDTTVSAIKRFEKFGLQIIVNKDNLGFAKGINGVVNHAHGKYLLFLNPDAEFLDGNLIELVNIFKKDDLMGIVGGKIVGISGQNELSCGREYSLPRVLFLAVGLDSIFGNRFCPGKEKEVDFVSGGFMMVSSSLFEKLHGFDENFFMYVEDAEFCYRVKKVGYKVFFSPVCTVRHLGQGSSNRTFAVTSIYKGILYLYKKHYSKPSYFFAKLFLLTKAYLLVLIGKILDNKYLVVTYGEAIKSI